MMWKKLFRIHKHKIVPIFGKIVIVHDHQLTNRIKKCKYDHCMKQYKLEYCKCGKQLAGIDFTNRRDVF